MKKNETYVKLYRSILENELWWSEPFTRGQAWVDLICLANFGTTATFFRGELQVVQRGQVKASYKFFEQRWKWSRNRVIKYFKDLKVLQMVSLQSTNNGTTITLENYDIYQDCGIAKGTAKGTAESTTVGTTAGTQNKNTYKKNNKKERDDGGIVVDANCLNPQGKIVIDSRGCEIFIPDRKEVG